MIGTWKHLYYPPPQAITETTKSFVMDAEVVAYDQEKDKILPFQGWWTARFFWNPSDGTIIVPINHSMTVLINRYSAD